MSESNLSDKIEWCPLANDKGELLSPEFGVLNTKDVHEAVQKLKHTFEKWNNPVKVNVIKHIEEIFGPQLCAEQTVEPVGT